MERAPSSGCEEWVEWVHQDEGIECNSGNRQTRRLDSYANHLCNIDHSVRNAGLGDRIVDSVRIAAVEIVVVAVALVRLFPERAFYATKIVAGGFDRWGVVQNLDLGQPSEGRFAPSGHPTLVALIDPLHHF